MELIIIYSWVVQLNNYSIFCLSIKNFLWTAHQQQHHQKKLIKLKSSNYERLSRKMNLAKRVKNGNLFFEGCELFIVTSSFHLKHRRRLFLGSKTFFWKTHFSSSLNTLFQWKLFKHAINDGWFKAFSGVGGPLSVD